MRITDSPARDRVVIVSRAHINCKSLTSQYLGEMYRDPDRDLDSLRAEFRGPLVTPGDADYDAAPRRVERDGRQAPVRCRAKDRG
jgi:hypothetical protein